MLLSYPNFKVITNVPSNFLNFLCATFYQHSSIFRMPCMKCIQKHFLKEIYVCSKFSCVCSSHDLCARTCTQISGNIGYHPFIPGLLKVWVTSSSPQVGPAEPHVGCENAIWRNIIMVLSSKLVWPQK